MAPGMGYSVPMFNFAAPFPVQLLPATSQSCVPSCGMGEEVKEKKRRRQNRVLSTDKVIKNKKERRLEQNRVSAVVSRRRKKAYIESLEAQVTLVGRNL